MNVCGYCIYLNIWTISTKTFLEIRKYGKCPKISNFVPYLFCQHFAFTHLFLEILSGMANSVDPDQTAPSGAV